MRKSFAPSQKLVPGSSNLPKHHQKSAVSSENIIARGNVKKFHVVYGDISSRKNKVYSSDGFLEMIGKKAVLKDENEKFIGSSLLKIEIEEGSKLQIGGKEVQVSEIINASSNVTSAASTSNKPMTKTVASEPSRKKPKSSVNANSPEQSKPESSFAHPRPHQVLKQIPSSLYKEQTNVSTSENFKLSEGLKKFNVNYGDVSTRKHKVYSSDGLLEISGKKAVLKDENGKFIGSSLLKIEIKEGSKLQIGGKEIEVIGETSNTAPAATSLSRSLTKNIVAEPPSKKFKSPIAIIEANSPAQIEKSSFFVLPRPPAEHQVLFEKPVIDVYVPESVAKHLKEYQKEGVEFLYNSVMGFTIQNYCGCILGDEMGLGKTVQTLALILTLLKTGPYSASVVKRIVIVTPSSLVANWDAEINKWLKDDRVFTFVVDGKQSIQQFVNSRHIPIMLVSYEMFTKHVAEIKAIAFDLMICDEGHRLKNEGLKLYQQLTQLKCRRRILLTGTPFQNSVHEYFALINFVNPRIFGSYEDFKVEYEIPIFQAQEPDADEEDREIGDKKKRAMFELTSKFMIARSLDHIQGQLPLKQELIVFVRPSKTQKNIISSLLTFYKEKAILSASLKSLEFISMLKKVCNHPNLLLSINATEHEKEVIRELFPDSLTNRSFGFSPNMSGKLETLNVLLEDLFVKNEKVVLASYSTKALDMLVGTMQKKDYKFLRLDGKTKTSDRMKIVNKFNDPDSEVFCLLLSAKSGGTGLNLVGASRLVLFDSDWNPVNDAQACARIFREGQKRNVFIYRFVTCGTIEEKIWQRQISKGTLGETVVDMEAVAGSSGNNFSDAEVKQLFNLESKDFEECQTHELMGCKCPCDGSVPDVELTDDESYSSVDTKKKAPAMKIHELMRFEHHKFPFDQEVLAEIGLAKAEPRIPFIFRNRCGNF